MLAHGAPTANSKPGNVVTVGIPDRETVEHGFRTGRPLTPENVLTHSRLQIQTPEKSAFRGMNLDLF